MIYIVIGQSGSGKTLFCKENLIKPPYKVIEDITPITEGANGAIAIGKYGIGRRCEGTDTLPYNAQGKIIEQIKKLSESGKDIVIEGDRATSKRVIESIDEIFQTKKMYLVTCSIKTSMERLKKAGSEITEAFVKATKTKSRRMFLEYGERFNGEIINTEGK